MTHPLYTLHLITDQVESIKIDLTDKNDKTAEVLKTVKQIQKNINELRENYNSEKSKLENEQNHYFDKIIFEFAPDNEFEGGIHRVMKGIQLDMKDINNWISAERRIANKNEEYMHARITLIDYDGNDLPDSEKIDEDSED
jgi:hypothetical protein